METYCLMVASGVLPLEDAYKAIDSDTITLLLDMMIIVANLRLSGFFAVITNWVMQHATCLILAPLVLELAISLKRNPLPYLLAVAMASNTGSVATITGNPQNIMIGSFSGIPYAGFSAALAPVAVAGLVVTIALIALLHRQEFRAHDRVAARVPRIRVNRVLMLRALAATAITIGLFFAGQPPAKAAIIMGALLLLTRRVKSARVYADIDWSLLLMFAGLFIIVTGAQHALLTPDFVGAVRPPASRSGARPRRRDGRALQPCQQRAGGACHAPVRRRVAGSPHGLVRHRDGVHAGGEFHRAGVGRQFDRRGESRRARRGDQRLGVFQGRGTAHDRHLDAWNTVAVAMS